jgi:hypothetical protein
LPKLTFFEANLTMATSDARTEIGSLAYPDSQPAAINGLTDLFIEPRDSRKRFAAAPSAFGAAPRRRGPEAALAER